MFIRFYCGEERKGVKNVEIHRIFLDKTSSFIFFSSIESEIPVMNFSLDSIKESKTLSTEDITKHHVEIMSYDENYDYDYEVLNLDDDQLSELPYEAKHAHVVEIDNISNILTASNPSEFVHVDRTAFEYMADYMVDNLELVQDLSNQLIPADIFIADTVPIKDLLFKVDILDLDSNAIHSVVLVRCVYINNQLWIVVSNKYGHVTAMKTKEYSDEYVCIDPSTFYIDHLTEYTMASIDYRHCQKSVPFHIAQYFISIWYTLQVMLLNPSIKEHMFIKSRKEKFRGDDRNMLGISNAGKKRKAKYIKYVKIDYETLTSNSIRNRHTLCWYVIGHYRKHGTGKVWVNGYWKGPLRHMKKNLDDGRERLI